MRKRTKMALAVLFVAAVGFAAWEGLRERELVYQGKRLSSWLKDYLRGGSVLAEVQPESRTDEVIRQIGTNAIPSLLQRLRVHDSSLKLSLLRLVRDQAHIDTINLEAGSRNRQAAAAFRALGPIASNAVPTIVRIYRERISAYSQRACVEALGGIGPGARSAIPDLIGATTNADYTLRAMAIGALGCIQAEPQVVVPVLLRSCQGTNMGVRLSAMSALAKFGLEAQSAVPVLTQSLRDPMPSIRATAARSLGALIHATAKAGVDTNAPGL